VYLEYFARPRDWVLMGRCCDDRSVILDRGWEGRKSFYKLPWKLVKLVRAAQPMKGPRCVPKKKVESPSIFC
jgi:hypothetical protein